MLIIFEVNQPILKKLFQIFLLAVICALCAAIFYSCTGDQPRGGEATGSISVPENPLPQENGREAWQKPQLILDLMGDLQNKTVADIGAGTGYFAFRLVNKAQKVIAIDIDQEMIQLMNSLAESLPESRKDKFETRLATPDDPRLHEQEVDEILIVNTIAYIENRTDYLANLRKYLKPGGKVSIIDYKVKRLPIQAPPYEDRVHIHLIEDAFHDAGYTQIKTNDTSLEYQYIIQGRVD